MLCTTVIHAQPIPQSVLGFVLRGFQQMLSSERDQATITQTQHGWHIHRDEYRVEITPGPARSTFVFVMPAASNDCAELEDKLVAGIRRMETQLLIPAQKRTNAQRVFEIAAILLGVGLSLRLRESFGWTAIPWWAWAVPSAIAAYAGLSFARREMRNVN
jgi:hypothetical protein